MTQDTSAGPALLVYEYQVWGFGVAPPRAFGAPVVTVHQHSVAAPLLATLPCTHPQPAVSFILESLARRRKGLLSFHQPFLPPLTSKMAPGLFTTARLPSRTPPAPSGITSSSLGGPQRRSLSCRAHAPAG